MFEKVNPAHPDKVADRIAGAIVDLAYMNNEWPHIAVEVLIGHKRAFLIIETDVEMKHKDIEDIVWRIAGIDGGHITTTIVSQDKNLNDNQLSEPRCGDNGIFKPVVVTDEQQRLTEICKKIYERWPTDGKYIINDDCVTVCQSQVEDDEEIAELLHKSNIDKMKINPLGYWVGGLDVDSGATNRKLGSDMGDGITGGGLHGKDLTKADVTLNICAYLDQQEYCCSIGDNEVNGRPYVEYIERAKQYIEYVGGFEKFAEYGLIR